MLPFAVGIGDQPKKNMSQEFPIMKKNQESPQSKSPNYQEVVMIEESTHTPPMSLPSPSTKSNRPKTSHTKKMDSFPIIGSVISTDIDPHKALLQPDNTNPQLLMLEQKYLEAKQRFQSYQLPAPVMLLSRNQHNKCARLYYAMYTLLQSSISASQADKLERYIRLKSSLFPASMFDLMEWEDALRVSRMVRTHELTDARLKLMAQSRELGNQLKHSSITLKSIVAEVNEFKLTVGQGITDVKLFMEEVQSMVLNVVATFAAKQDNVIKSLQTSNANLSQELDMERDTVAHLDHNITQMEAQIAAMKEKQTQLVTRVMELTKSEASLNRRNEELTNNIEENTKKGVRAARIAALELSEKEAEVAQAKAETVLAHEETKKITLALEQMTSTHRTTQRQLENNKTQSAQHTLQLKTTIEHLQQEALTASELAKEKYQSLYDAKTKENEQFQQQQKQFNEQQAAWTAESDLLVKKERAYGKLALQELETTIQELTRELTEERAKTSRLASLEEELALLRTTKQPVAEATDAASVSTATYLPSWDNSPVKEHHDPNGTARSCANTDHLSQETYSGNMSPFAGDDPMKKMVAMDNTPPQISPDPDIRERSSVGNLLAAGKSESPLTLPETATITVTTTKIYAKNPSPPVEVTSSSMPNNPSDNTNDASSDHVVPVDTTTMIDMTIIPSTEAAAAAASAAADTTQEEGVVDSAAPGATLSRDVSFSDGSEMSFADASARNEPEITLTESPNVTMANGEKDGAVVDSKKVDSKEPVAASITSTVKFAAVTNEEKKDDNNDKSKPSTKNSRRDTMMAVAGEEGTADEAVELSELEDKFLTAVAYNKQATVEECLKQDKTIINVKNGFGRDAIQIASRNGNITLMEYLLKQGASLSTVGNNDDTLFHLAAFNGQQKVVRWLVKMGAKDVAKAVDKNQRTVMHVAGKRSELEILQYLQEQVGFDLRIPDCDGRSVLDCIPRFGDDKERLDLCRSFVQDICRNLDAADRSREEVRAKIKK